MGANILEFNGVVLSVVGDVSSTARRLYYGGFVNLEDLSSQLKMLIEVGFSCVCSYG